MTGLQVEARHVVHPQARVAFLLKGCRHGGRGGTGDLHEVIPVLHQLKHLLYRLHQDSRQCSGLRQLSRHRRKELLLFDILYRPDFFQNFSTTNRSARRGCSSVVFLHRCLEALLGVGLDGRPQAIQLMPESSQPSSKLGFASSKFSTAGLGAVFAFALALEAAVGFKYAVVADVVGLGVIGGAAVEAIVVVADVAKRACPTRVLAFTSTLGFTVPELVTITRPLISRIFLRKILSFISAGL